MGMIFIRRACGKDARQFSHGGCLRQTCGPDSADGPSAIVYSEPRSAELLVLRLCALRTFLLRSLLVKNTTARPAMLPDDAIVYRRRLKSRRSSIHADSLKLTAMLSMLTL